MTFYTRCANCGKKIEAWDKDLTHELYCLDCVTKAALRDTTPICLICGESMEWTGESREIELDGGFAGVVEDPIYACYNPECYGGDDDDF